MKRIQLNERFGLEFKIKIDDLPKIEKMLIENKIIYSFCGTGFPAFVIVMCCANIRKAEIIRVLLKNIKVYD
jgi:hypothetical protein